MGTISAADTMEIVIQKGAILGVIFAVVFGLVAGFGVLYAIILFTWSSTNRLVKPIACLVTVACALLAGWGGWELGHWFTGSD